MVTQWPELKFEVSYPQVEKTCFLHRGTMGLRLRMTRANGQNFAQLHIRYPLRTPDGVNPPSYCSVPSGLRHEISNLLLHD